MRKGRAVFGAAAVIVIATILVPLELAFIDIDSSAAKTQTEIARLVHDSRVLALIFLCVSVFAGCMVFSAAPTKMKLYARALLSLASLFCSFACGILVGLLTEYYWGRIAFSLIR